MISVDGASLPATSAGSRPSQTCGPLTNTPMSSGKADVGRDESDVYRSNCSQGTDEMSEAQGSDEMSEECLVCKRPGNLRVTLQVLYLTFLL